MGIIILLTILVIIFTTLFILSLKFTDDYDLDIWEITATISAVIGFCCIVCLFVTSIFCIVANSNYTKRKVRIEYSETVESLNITRQYIKTITEDYARSMAVTEYNHEVKVFKSDLKNHKNRLNNKWINWFICSEYKKLDIDAIDYIK